jgi:hypothetical protein
MTDCDELKEQLSAFADGELTHTQINTVKEHTAACADCRETLAGYQETRRKITSLWVTPPLPGITETTLAAIKKAGIPWFKQKWARPVFALVPVVAVLSSLLSLHLSGAFISLESVIASAQATEASVDSFRARSSFSSKWPGVSWMDVSVGEADYAGPRLYRVLSRSAENYHPQLLTELIVIGDRVYGRQIPDTGGPTGEYKTWLEYAVQGLPHASIPSGEYTASLLKSLIDVRRMPAETIDGTDCLHYSGKIDMEKFIEELVATYTSRGLDPEPAGKIYSDREIEVEVWFGKEDYLVRQVKQATRRISDESYEGNATRSTEKYFDFNQPVTVEPPLDAEGKLLPGWQMVITREGK